jgi:hypothetical protein
MMDIQVVCLQQALPYGRAEFGMRVFAYHIRGEYGLYKESNSPKGEII